MLTPYTDKPSFKFNISHRQDGTMQFVGGEEALNNRRKYLSKMGIKESQVVAGKLVGGNNIITVGEGDGGKAIEATDGLITTTPGIYLSITVADCIPVIIYQEGSVLALLHVGRQGLACGIIPKAIQQLENMGFAAPTLHSYLGPHICPKDYNIPPDVAAQFVTYPTALSNIVDKSYLDISEVAKIQLTSVGVVATNIVVDETCTFESEDFFSARRDKSTPTQAMMVLASL